MPTPTQPRTTTASVEIDVAAVRWTLIATTVALITIGLGGLGALGLWPVFLAQVALTAMITATVVWVAWEPFDAHGMLVGLLAVGGFGIGYAIADRPDPALAALALAVVVYAVLVTCTLRGEWARLSRWALHGLASTLAAMRVPVPDRWLVRPPAATPRMTAAAAPLAAERSGRSTGRAPLTPSRLPGAAGPSPEQTREETPACMPPAPLRELLAQLDDHVGLGEVKTQVRELTALLRMQVARRESGLKTPSTSHHLRFEGPPGTGKTTIARLVGQIMHSLGLLERGHFIEAGRSDLVGEYQGQTAKKVNELCDRALGGCLFIDEAYALCSGEGDTFGQEALSTLIARIENDRGKFVCILAGYSREMAELMDSNPGLRSRFGGTIKFPQYTPDELVLIARKLAHEADYHWKNEAEELLRRELGVLLGQRDEHWGNGREVRGIFERCLRAQAVRLSGKTNDVDLMRELTAEDLEQALATYRRERDADRDSRAPFSILGRG